MRRSFAGSVGEMRGFDRDVMIGLDKAVYIFPRRCRRIRSDNVDSDGRTGALGNGNGTRSFAGRNLIPIDVNQQSLIFCDRSMIGVTAIQG